MNRHPAPAFPKHLYSLDVVRGLAALSIVIFHWGHFFYRGSHPAPDFDAASLPFHSFLFLFYEGGEMVVDLFFVLSGFVFYWLYSEKIADRSIGAWNFLVLRFSRLYPLHFATLLLVLLLQSLYREQTGTAFVYPHNDLYHFGLQLAFVSEWGFQSGHSFNGPIWSVSIEILLYAIFFLACAFRCYRATHAVALCLLGLAIHAVNGQIGRGVFAFFAGGVAFFLARGLLGLGIGRVGLRVVLSLCVLAWVATVISVKFSLADQFTAWLQAMDLRGLSDRTIAAICSHAGKKTIVGGLFPLTILSAVLLEARFGSFGRRFAIFGDVSYSSYLLHFPLQLFFATLFAWLHWSTDIFRQGWTLVAFYLILIPLSVLVFRLYERPAQAALRKLLIRERPEQTPAAIAPTRTVRGEL